MDVNHIITVPSTCQPVQNVPVLPYSYQTGPFYLPTTPTNRPNSQRKDGTHCYLSTYSPCPISQHGTRPPVSWYQDTPSTHLSHSLSYPQLTPSSVSIVSPFLTPPTTPNSISNESTATGSTGPLQVLDSTQDSNNPVLRNKAAREQYKLYLEQTWPEGSRKGTSTIHSSLYMKIAETLQNEELAKPRFKQWVRNSEFFLIESNKADGRACLAVPVVKGRGSRSSANRGNVIQGKRSHSYKLVARLEDFAHIIGTYHNDERGHHGIRKTYAKIQEDFSFLPRAAVTKYIELCDICSLHRSKAKRKPTKTADKAPALAESTTPQCENIEQAPTDVPVQRLSPTQDKTRINALMHQLRNEGYGTELHLDSIISYISNSCV